MAAERPEGPAPTMMTSRTDILVDNSALVKKFYVACGMLTFTQA
jgi:hypothetical protein